MRMVKHDLHALPISVLPKFENASNHLKLALQNSSGSIFKWWNMIYVRSVLFLWISGNFNEISVPPKFDQSRTRRGWISRILAQMPLTTSKLHFKIHQDQYSNGEPWFTCAPYYFYEYLAILMKLVYPLNLTKVEPLGAGFQGFCLKMPLTTSKLHFKIHQDQYSNGETWFTCAPYYFYEYLAILMKLVYPLNLTKVEPIGAGFQGFCLKMPLTTSKLHSKFLRINIRMVKHDLRALRIIFMNIWQL